MSYTALCHFVQEEDLGYIIKYETRQTAATVGQTFGINFDDFTYNNKKYYPLYAITVGEIFCRDENRYENGIECRTMVISESEYFSHWFIFCTDKEESKSGDIKQNLQDFMSEVFITDTSRAYTTKGSQDVISIRITSGAMSDTFASYGSTFSPSLTFSMFSCDFTDAIMAGMFEGNIVRVMYTFDKYPNIPIPIGEFVIKGKPEITEETVSFTAVGLIEEYMGNAQIDIKALNEYHREEIENKYVGKGPYPLENLRIDSDLYFWEFLPEDCLRVTGIPLYIEDWDEAKNDMWNYQIQQLLIPTIEDVESSEENGGEIGEINYASRITWRELLSGIAVLLRGNVIEKNGAIYIKKMPEIPVNASYKQVFDASSYDNSSRFGNDLMCPSDIYVKSNNWWFYERKEQKNIYPLAFGYYNGESKVKINGEKSNYGNVSYYPVTIDCPWILFETINRTTNGMEDNRFHMNLWFGYERFRKVPMQWGELGKKRNRAFLYHECNVNMLGWHPAFSAGEIIITENYKGEKRYAYIGEMTLTYDGSIVTEISSRCEIENENNSYASGNTASSYSSGAEAGGAGANMSLQLGVTIKDGVISGSKIIDSTITGSKISESTITNSNIADTTITGSKFADGTITGSKIDNSTITNSHIVDGTLDGNTKIANATISFEKVNTSFINDLTADNAYINKFKADVANINYLTADDAIIKNIQSVAISADYIKAITADIGYLTTNEADIKYASITLGNIDTANIDKANIGLLLNEVGLIDQATIVDGHITGFLDAVQINATNITAGTLDAGTIEVTNLKASSITVGQINGHQIAPGAIDMGNLSQTVTGEISSANSNAANALNEALAALNKSNEAALAAGAAQATADGKNTVFYQTTEPTGTHKVNDVWFDTDDGNKMYGWTGSAWSDKQFDTNAISDMAITNAKISNLDAGKITTGFLDAGRIGANTITANKIAIADFTNYATANENFPSTNIPTGTFGGSAVSGGYIVKPTATNTYLMLCDYTPCSLKNGEQIYYEMSIKGAVSGKVGPRIWYYNADKNYAGASGITNHSVNTTEAVISGTITVSSIADSASYFLVGISDDNSTRNQIYVREVKFIRKNAGNLIVDGAITAGKLSANAVTADKINAGAVTTAKIAAGAVTAGTIASGAISTDKLESNAVTADKIASRTITADRIVSGAITSNEIAASAITTNKLAANSITAAKIASGAITADKIAANAVTAEKINVNDLSALGATIGGFDITENQIKKASFLSNNEESATILSTNSIFANDDSNKREGSCLHSYNKNLTGGTLKVGQWLEIVEGELYAGIYDISQTSHSPSIRISGQRGIVTDNLDCQKATTSIYGLTKLSNSISSSTALAATPYMVSQVNDKFNWKKITKRGSGTVSTSAAFASAKEAIVQLMEYATGNYYTFTWNVDLSIIGMGNGIKLVSGYRSGATDGVAIVRFGRETSEIIELKIGGVDRKSTSDLTISYR